MRTGQNGLQVGIFNTVISLFDGMIFCLVKFYESLKFVCLENGVHIVYKRELKLDQKDKDDGEFCGLDNEITEEDLVEDESGVFEDVFVTGQRLQQISDLVV